MTIKVHGRSTSINVQSVMWCLAEIGLDHTRLDVGGAFGGNRTPEFVAKNPMGLVPVVEDGALTLFESQAILRYLAAQYDASQLWPAAAAARAPIDQWMEWAKTTVSSSFIAKLFWQLVRTSKADRDLALVQSGIEDMDLFMSIADAQIGKGGWLAGDQMTLADISFGTVLYRYFTLDFERPEHDNVKRYYDRLAQRAAYKKHVMISFESLYATNT
jgi:glutathione S-transferase